MQINTIFNCFAQCMEMAKKSMVLAKSSPKEKKVFLAQKSTKKHKQAQKNIFFFIFWSIPNFFSLFAFTGEQSKRVSCKNGGISLRSMLLILILILILLLNSSNSMSPFPVPSLHHISPPCFTFHCQWWLDYGNIANSSLIVFLYCFSSAK